jgi:uncharacterized protein YuzE
MKITYDAVANAAYIYLVPIGKGQVARTMHVHGNSNIILDFDKDDRLLGIEFLRPDANLHPRLRASAKVYENRNKKE